MPSSSRLTMPKDHQVPHSSWKAQVGVLVTRYAEHAPQPPGRSRHAAQRIESRLEDPWLSARRFLSVGSAP
jgi:hypothetical protein